MIDNEESKFLYHTSCEQCGSSDANAVYSNNTTYCFSCTAWDRLNEEEDMEEFDNIDISWVSSLGTRGFRDRQIKKVITEFFDVKVKEYEDEVSHHYYPYTRDGQIVAYKEREVENKRFKVHGDMKKVELFGQSKFPQGGRKLIITEGEIDALAVAQATHDHYNKVYPVVSIPTGAGSKKALLQNRDWIRSFDEVVLMFDMDEAGQKSIQQAAKIIGTEKTLVAQLKFKDPSDSYLAVGKSEIIEQTFSAQPWCPPGVINDVKEFERQYLEERDAVYTSWAPFASGLNDKVFGRRLGSITMFTSGTGCGKTTFLREDAYHIFNTTEDNVGVCSLEESIGETIRGFISLHLNQRVGIPGSTTTLEEEQQAIQHVFGNERFMLLDHQGSVSDGSITDKIEFMAASGCKYIYLDHITICISEDDGDTNKAADKLMSDLLKIAKKHNVWIGVVSHLRKTGGNTTSFEDGADIDMDSLKGSGSLKQISAQIIALSRNLNTEDESKRHIVKMSVLKCRFSGNTGPCGYYRFTKRGRLEKATGNETGFEILE